MSGNRVKQIFSKDNTDTKKPAAHKEISLGKNSKEKTVMQC